MNIRILKSLQCKSTAANEVVQPTPKRFFSLPQKPSSKLLSKPSPDSTQLHLDLLLLYQSIGRPTSRFPVLVELPHGHPSRNVVEIIFRTSWFPEASSSPATVDMVFKVDNHPKTLSYFEEYRERVKGVVGEDDPGGRCAADGNELMRFQQLGPAYPLEKVHACTFSRSGAAHRSGNEGGRREGRRAMMVCRVVAGRVCTLQGTQQGWNGRAGFDSVIGENDELFVEDPRAVLPCFIIAYTL